MQGQKLIIFIDEWEVEEVGKWMKIIFWKSLNLISFLFMVWKKYGFIDLVKREEVQVFGDLKSNFLPDKQTKNPWYFKYYRFLS